MSNKQKDKENKIKNKKTKDNNKKTKKGKKKMKVWKKIVLFLLLIIMIFGGVLAYKTYKNGGGLAGFLATAVGHDENTKKNLGELKVLILGVSTDQEGTYLTDTIMVATYNPNTQKSKILSIPRDTFVGKSAKTATASQKINALYGSNEDPEKTLKAVNEITGLDIKYYAVVKTEALINLVDAIGEVEFNVPIDMNYDDSSQDLHIHFTAETQKINGEEAEELLRFRHNNNGTTYSEEYGDNDFGRMRTQRDFIVAVLKQTLKPGNIFKIGQILEIANKNLTTNLELSYIKDYIPYAVEFNTEDMETAVLPGASQKYNSIWFFVYNKTEAKELIQNMFYSSEYLGDTESNTEETNTTNIANTQTNTASNTTSSDSTNSKIKIELLNGCGDKDEFENAKSILKNAGYNVTKTGTTSAISKTVITNKKDLSDTVLKEIKEKLGVGSISTSKSSTSLVDATIIIGKDFK